MYDYARAAMHFCLLMDLTIYPSSGRFPFNTRIKFGELDNLDSVGVLYTEDDFRQLVVAIEATPTFFGSLGKLEDHGERGLV
jgi:hypothetical protein